MTSSAQDTAQLEVGGVIQPSNFLATVGASFLVIGEVAAYGVGTVAPCQPAHNPNQQ